MSGRKITPGQAEWLPLGSLIVGDENPYQRKIRQAWLEWLTENFNPDDLGVIEVAAPRAVTNNSRRRRGDEPEDRYPVKEGQHRVMSMRAKGYEPDDLVLCHVMRHDSVQAEARAARDLNRNRRAWGSYDDFNAGLIAGDPECKGVAAILNRVGIKVVPGASREEAEKGGLLFAISTCMTIHRRTGGSVLLERVLRIINSAWPSDPLAMRSVMINGLAYFLANHWEGVNLNEERLIQVLKGTQATPEILIEAAKALKRHQSWGLPCYVAMAIEGTYNLRLGHANRLRETMARQYATALTEYEREYRYREHQGQEVGAA